MGKLFVRLVAAVVVVASTVMGLSSAAAADPAGPTDYRTEIVSISPELDQLELAVLGGDSFLELKVQAGTEVEIVGYENEPYLKFEADGTVVQNENSPTRWQNDDRLGDIAIPANATADAEPDWIEVASDGVYAWHDHRAHWMSPEKPIGADPGDAVIDGRQIFLDVSVDDQPTQEVIVEIRSILLEPPSPVSSLLGAVLGVGLGGLGVAAWSLRGRLAASLLILGLVVSLWSLAAVVVAMAAIAGLPAEAAPGWITWLLPAVGVVAVLGAVFAERSVALDGPLGSMVLPGAVLLASSELVLWAWLRRDGVFRSLIPTEAPQWFDRATVAGAVTLGAVGVVVAILTLVATPAPADSRAALAE